MTEQITAAHAAYCKALGRDVPMMPAFERWWFDCLHAGITIEDVVMVMEDRRKKIKIGKRFPPSVLLRNLIASDEALAAVAEEASEIKARRRKQTFPYGKQQVLKATGRSSEPAMENVRHVSEVLKAITDGTV